MLAILLAAPAEAATRIKDITLVKNVRPNQLIGYGIVVGLNGTGDTLRGSPFTSQSIQSMLDRMGINIRANTANNANPVQTKNAAAVIVTTELPAFARRGGAFGRNRFLARQRNIACRRNADAYTALGRR